MKKITVPPNAKCRITKCIQTVYHVRFREEDEERFRSELEECLGECRYGWHEKARTTISSISTSDKSLLDGFPDDTEVEPVMTVGGLKTLLETLPQDIPVISIGSDWEFPYVVPLIAYPFGDDFYWPYPNEYQGGAFPTNGNPKDYNRTEEEWEKMKREGAALFLGPNRKF
jgi:hypothetical protein